MEGGLGPVRQVQRLHGGRTPGRQHRDSVHVCLCGAFHGRQEPLRGRSHVGQSAAAGPALRQHGPQVHDEQGAADLQRASLRHARGDGVGCAGVPEAPWCLVRPDRPHHLPPGHGHVGRLHLQRGPPLRTGPHQHGPLAAHHQRRGERAPWGPSCHHRRTLVPQARRGVRPAPAPAHRVPALLVRPALPGRHHFAPRPADQCSGAGVHQEHRRDAVRGHHAAQAHGLRPHREGQGLRALLPQRHRRRQAPPLCCYPAARGRRRAAVRAGGRPALGRADRLRHLPDCGGRRGHRHRVRLVP
mmetsp:Transcript_19156/g.57536  ORF Transcript_19156/g.57536 Transcript_19156/m.57536 type:complete len:300 (+) Transcript_19156:395-1294(+)